MNCLLYSRYNNLRKKEELSKVLFHLHFSNTITKMTWQIPKEFVIKKIQDHLEYSDNFMKMLCQNSDISYSDEQFDLDSDKTIECQEILKMLKSDQLTPNSAYQKFNQVIHAQI